MKKYLCSIIAILILSGCTSFKKNAFIKMTGGTAVDLQKPVTVPFKIISTHIMLVEPILDGYPCSFVFDTGGIAMMDTCMIDKIKNMEVTKIAEKVKMGRIKESKLNGLIVKDMNFILNPFTDTFKVSNKPIYGMIGSNFIRHFNTTIDYQKNVLVFENEKKLKKTSAKSHLMKMDIILPCFPTVPASFKHIPIKAMLDTGLNYPFVFPLSQMENLSPVEKTKLVKAKGYFAKWPFTTKTDNYLYRAENLVIGDIECNYSGTLR